jgi:hypothetical protein
MAASSPRRAAVRLTGSARNIDPGVVELMYETVVGAFSGCDITVLSGGTRMVMRTNPRRFLPGITEVLPLIAAASPQARTIGVVPRQTKLVMQDGVGLIVSDKPVNDFVTIIHPDLDACLLLQYSADKGFTDWNMEWELSLDYLEALRNDASYFTGHLVYGGGKTTERELLHVVRLGHNPAKPWLVILVSDSSGVAAKYANDRNFCDTYSDRLVVCSARDLTEVLNDHGFIG